MKPQKQNIKRIGVLVIGQTPRPDLLIPLETRLPNVQIVQVGALDGLTPGDLPNVSDARYPLTTKMDGQWVFVSEDFLIPRLQTALDQLQSEDVSATILLCAGTFANLRCNYPLIRPFNIGLTLLQSLNVSSLGLIAPFPEQEAPIQQRWERYGFQTAVWTADLNNQDEQFQNQLSETIRANEVEAIILDYVGHPQELVQRLQHTSPIPVIDLGDVAIRMLAAMI